jgi:hypothetical protein
MELTTSSWPGHAFHIIYYHNLPYIQIVNALFCPGNLKIILTGCPTSRGTNIAQLGLILKPYLSSTHLINSEFMSKCTKMDTEIKTSIIPKTTRAQI